MFTDELLSIAWLSRAEQLDDLQDPDPDTPVGVLSRQNLRKSQHRAIELIEQCFADKDPLPGVLIAFPPSAGKTGVVLQAFRRLFDQGKVKKALIVAPLLVAKTGWPEEIYEWLETQSTTWTLLRVEDDDPEMLEYADRVYARALRRFQAIFDLHVAREPALRPPQRRGAVLERWKQRAEARRSPDDTTKLCKSPGDLAGRIRDRYALRFKYAKLARLAAEPTELHIINKEALPWLWEHTKQGKRWTYDVCVCDDLRETRSGKKRVARGKSEEKKAAPLSRFGILARARKHMKAMILLCGTPTPKGLVNVWGNAYLVDLGERLGTSKTAYEERWFWTNSYARKITPHDHSFGEIVGKIKDIMFSLDIQELAAELPEEPLIVPVRVKLPAKVMKEYVLFKRKMISELYDVEAVNAGVLHNKLLQFANGSLYDAEGESVWVHDAKIDALKEIVEQLEGRPLIVAYDYEFDVRRILKVFPNAEVLRPENATILKKRWNQDDIPLLLAHRASAGHGLNLQKGTGYMCEYGLTTDAELYRQFMYRLQRPGRRDRVVNYVIMADGTIDDEVFPMYLDPKLAEEDRFLEAIRIR